MWSCHSFELQSDLGVCDSLDIVSVCVFVCIRETVRKKETLKIGHVSWASEPHSDVIKSPTILH